MKKWSLPNINILYDQLVKMRDGVDIFCDVYLPKEELTFSTLLIRTPYNKDDVFNQGYAHDDLSLQFTQGPDWISVNPSTGQVHSGASETLTVTADATGQEEGLYEGYLRLVTSGGNAGVPVSMLVSEGGSVMPGDINGDESVNIQDIIYLINYILGNDSPDEDQFLAGDMNEDGLLNIQDVILLINVILDS